ncbi:MAG TPA: hypothetical protein VKV40_00110 [Ktedonobacteraceae bacterium]|nr:hypothetical protein [Ktedonobacteraceae bacterium]
MNFGIEAAVVLTCAIFLATFVFYMIYELWRIRTRIRYQRLVKKGLVQQYPEDSRPATDDRDFGDEEDEGEQDENDEEGEFDGGGDEGGGEE